ncbi:RnfABCDGE type electron transport complex subunit G [Chitinibacteraceae bacterium HSL-7]
MRSDLANALRGAVTLAVFALVFVAVLAVSHGVTRERALANEAAARKALVVQALPGVRFDNDVLADAQQGMPDAALGGDVRIYPARHGQTTVARVFEVTAKEGYGGDIRLLVGVTGDLRVLAIRVLSHKETPGLGDYIEAAKSDWSRQFANRGLEPDSAWKVKKDGGAFDYMAGATVSPRAVIKTVHATLAYAQTHAKELK